MDREKFLQSMSSPEEIDKIMKEFEVKAKKGWYDFAVAQLKRGG